MITTMLSCESSAPSDYKVGYMMHKRCDNKSSSTTSMAEMKASQQQLQGGQNCGDSSRGAAEASIVFGTVREIRSEDFLSEVMAVSV